MIIRQNHGEEVPAHDFALATPVGLACSLAGSPRSGNSKMMKRQNHPGEVRAHDLARKLPVAGTYERIMS
jgi:hypothetical protein